MQVENPLLRQFLDNCLYSLFFLNAKQYMNYKIRYIQNEDYNYAAVYEPDENELVIVDHNFNNEELLYCTALHELAHHIQYINEGETDHNVSFNNIHHSLLIAAFEHNYLNPSKLLLSEVYLSSYKERNRIITVCLNYISNNETETYNIETRSSEPKRYKSQYRFNPLLRKYYRFIKNKTKKAPGLIEKD